MRFLLVFISFTLFLCAANKEILLLHSYNQGLKWTDGITEGVQEVIKQDPTYELTTEYMDSKKIDSTAYFNALLTLYEKKFKNRDYAAIIAADNYAYEFVLKYHEKLFPTTPVIFCGVENFDYSLIEKYKAFDWVTGVIEYKDIKGSFKLIKKLIPDLSTLYIISDNAYSSRRIKQQILDAAKEFDSEFKTIYDNSIEMETIFNKISSLPKNSAVLYTSLYRDKNDRYIPYHEINRLFYLSKYPVFAINSIHLDEGSVGGLMISPQDQGREAMKRVFQIIKENKKIEYLPIITPVAKYFIDYNFMIKHKIPYSKVPKEATVINVPQSFVQKHQVFVYNVFAISPILLFMVIILLITLYNRSKLAQKIEAQSKLDDVLLNNIQSAIFWRNQDGIMEGCNRALCRLLNKPKKDIIGVHVNEIMPQFCELVNSNENFRTDLEIQYVTPKGDIKDLMLKRKLFDDVQNKQKGVVSIITDITERKKIETEHKRNEQFVIQRSKQAEVGEMLTSIAHQWKSPLVEISAIAQELLYKRKKQDISQEDTKSFVDDIMGQVTYMTKTIDDFRKFIKPSNKEVGFDVKMALEEILHVLSHTIKYNYINIHLTTDEKDSYFSFGYPNEFKQTVLNILNNAKDSILKCRESGEEDVGNIYLHVKIEDDNVCIEIKDDGLGFKDDVITKVFDPFFSTKLGGDGFGLYMAKLIIEDKMNGKISASNWKEGAKMNICIKHIITKDDTILS